MSLVLPDPEKPPIVQCPHCHTGLGSIGTMIQGSLAVMVHNEPHCNAVLGGAIDRSTSAVGTADSSTKRKAFMSLRFCVESGGGLATIASWGSEARRKLSPERRVPYTGGNMKKTPQIDAEFAPKNPRRMLIAVELRAGFDRAADRDLNRVDGRIGNDHRARARRVPGSRARRP